ncbi:hypothetical protein P8452_68472 [Trifolium repens]|nr:hypothetical protein P8452_68472 [Trifolium repens]
MPIFPNLESRLELFDSSGKTLEATLNMVASECPNDSPPLSMLKSFHIDGMGLDLKKIPKDWMQNLTSLQYLQINWFTSEIFHEIGVWFKDSHNCLPSLQILSFHNCEDLEALPDWICNLSSLTHLSIDLHRKGFHGLYQTNTYSCLGLLNNRNTDISFAVDSVKEGEDPFHWRCKTGDA